MLKYFVLSLCLFAGLAAYAQAGWNWPQHPEEEKMAKEKQALYKVEMQLEKYDNALRALGWLYKHTPDLNESIYIDGARIMDNILEGDIPESRKKGLQDSVLWTYDARIKHFNNEVTVIDRKAYAAFKMYYKLPAKYPLLLTLYEQLYANNPEVISDFNLAPYMTLAFYYYKSDSSAMPMEKVLDVHGRITQVIDRKISAGGNVQKLQKEQDKVDAFLSNMGGSLSCEFIEVQLVPKFDANPEDLNLAKKIFSYSLKAKCTDRPYFVKAGELYFTSNPSYTLAKALADRFYSNNELEKAYTYYTKAKELANDDQEKFEALIGEASTLGKQGEKSKARAVAYEAVSLKPGASEAFNLIGNLYFSSFAACKGGVSKVKDRALFLAAYKMYEKAGNQEQMAASKEQFPSIEEIFDEGYEEGQQITVDCWVNETVVIRRR